MSNHQTEEARPRMKAKKYEKELRKLQAELCRLQDWVVREGLRVIVIFEGRDAAGKGGTIKAITERVSPRVFRVVALPAPSDREKTQLYAQRYIQHFARDKRKEGMALTEATLEASRTRLRPIVMTSFAFILGVFPLVIASGAGAEMRRTLGTAVFSGTIGVTAFGIFLTPVFYYAIMRLADPGGAGPSAEKVTAKVQEATADGSYGKKGAVEEPGHETAGGLP
jgi:hypothetical protein